ncbi:MAG: stage V sporulation protein E [Planctomycetaceae bacterium]|nr:stage V sporulation protein E [Planctomycetaceae bacterium]
MADNIDMLHAGHLLMWSVIALLGLGVVMVNSAAFTLGGSPVTIESMLMGRPTVYALGAIGVMWFTSRLDIRRFNARGGLMNPVLWLLGLAIGLCVAALIPGVGENINGSSRWIRLPLPPPMNVTFQPSEVAKWTLVLAVAWWVSRHAGAMRSFRRGMLPVMAVVGLIGGLVIVEDLGTAVLIVSVAGVMMLASGAPAWKVLAPVPLGVAAVAAAIIHSPYRMQRLTGFLDPFADERGAGYHLIQSLVAVGGGSTAWGLGNGPQKLDYLPADTTDFLFAVICEELGLAGAALVAALFGVLIWSIHSIVRDCRHPFGQLVGVGVLATIGLQALMNMAVVTALVPTKGIALPLVSAGGTGWILTAAAVGLVVATDRLNRVEAEEAGVMTEINAGMVPVVSVSASRCDAV